MKDDELWDFINKSEEIKKQKRDNEITQEMRDMYLNSGTMSGFERINTYRNIKRYKNNKFKNEQ